MLSLKRLCLLGIVVVLPYGCMASSSDTQQDENVISAAEEDQRIAPDDKTSANNVDPDFEFATAHDDDDSHDDLDENSSRIS